MRWQDYNLTRTVRGKLLIAFAIVLALNIAVGTIGWRGFRDTDGALAGLQSRVIPDIASAVELTRRSSALAALAPFVGSVQVMNKLDSESSALVRQLENFQLLVEAQASNQNHTPDLNRSLQLNATQLDKALRDLIATTHANLSVRSDVLELSYDFDARTKFAKQLSDMTREGKFDNLQGGLDMIEDFRTLTDLVFEAMTTESTFDLTQQRRQFDEVSAKIAASPINITGLHGFIEQQRKVFELRQRELDTLQRTRFLLASIHAYSAQLSSNVSAIVQETTRAAVTSWAETAAALETGKTRILVLGAIAVLLAIVTAVYIISTLARDLRSVANAMSGLANGDRTVSVPGLDRPDEIGELTRAFNVFKEHSFDRELLAERLSVNSDLLEAMFTNLTDGLSVFDAEFRLVAWNPQFPALLKLDPAVLSKGVALQSILQLLNGQGSELRQPYGDLVEETEFLLSRLSDVVQYELHFADGRVLDLRSKPMPQGGFVTMYSDLTARRAIERQLRVSQRMDALGQLTGGIAHDFNNLLAVVSGNLQLLQESFGGENTDSVRILRALDAVERATAVTHRLLSFSRQQALQPEHVAIDELLAGLLDLIGYSLGHHIELVVNLNAPVDQVLVDPAELENAILNLVFNGRDAMPDGGVLEISTYIVPASGPGDDLVVLKVRDNGVGMSAEVATRAPEPFFTTKGVGSGTGLGLSMVYGFVEQSGGQTEIISELNKGTEVSIKLPRLTTEKVRSTIEHPRQLPGIDRPMAKEIILLVEDDALVRNTTIDMLESLGYRTESVGSAPDAIAVLDARSFDLMITDVMLPDGFTGLDVAEHAAKRHPSMKVVFISGFAIESIRKRVPLEHSVAILQKPFRAEALAGLIRDQFRADQEREFET